MKIKIGGFKVDLKLSKQELELIEKTVLDAIFNGKDKDGKLSELSHKLWKIREGIN